MDDTELKALLMLDAPPAHDLRFELTVMAQIEKSQFRRALLRNAGVAVLAALVLALLAPPLELVWQRNFAPIASNTLIATLLLLVTLFWSQMAARRNFKGRGAP